MSLTDEDRQGMSPAEIELLSEGLEADGTPREEGSTPEPDADEVDEDPADDAAPAPAAAPAAAPADAQPEPESADEAPAAAFVPQYTAEVPADAAEQIAALKQEERAAFRKLMDGDSDMEPDAYEAIRDRTEQAIDALKTKTLTASIFAQANEQAQMQAAKVAWDKAQADCFAQFKAEGQDYQDKGKPGLNAAYNHHLKSLAANPANETKDASWFLREAHRLTRADLGLTTVARTPAARGVDKTLIPPTLSRVPPAADASIAGDEFAHLSGLDGAALERAVAKMTPEQQERWLN